MLGQNAILATEVSLDPPLEAAIVILQRKEGEVAILLDGERRAILDPADERSIGFARILDGLRQQKLPAYVEIDPKTRALTRLLIPHIGYVQTVRRDGEDRAVSIGYSHARHILSRASEDFDALEKQLDEARRRNTPVLLVEDDAHIIIHVEPFKPRDGDTQPPRPARPRRPRGWPFDRLADLFEWVLWWPIWPWRWVYCWRCISPRRAQQVFDAMGATTCPPLTVPAPCIPFMYPDDGCWGRAHEMARLMIAMGLRPKKVWIQGSLAAPTRNNPNCVVHWGWHVAPTICVRNGWFRASEMVIDPSLFTAPVTKSGWKGVQGDPGATLTDSGADIFYLWGNATDPTYTQTNQVLATYRLQLQNRSVQIGPPPYANCP